MQKNEKRVFKQCEVLTTNAPFDLNLENGEKIHVKKGEMGIVGFDNCIHFLNRRVVEEIDMEGAEIKGISARGLSDFITGYLEHNLNLSGILREWSVDCDMFTEYIVAALKELGLEDDLSKENE